MISSSVNMNSNKRGSYIEKGSATISSLLPQYLIVACEDHQIYAF